MNTCPSSVRRYCLLAVVVGAGGALLIGCNNNRSTVSTTLNGEFVFLGAQLHLEGGKVGLADFNNDGIPDFFSVDTSGTAFVAIREANRFYAAQKKFDIPANRGSFQFCDMDGDGNIDVHVGASFAKINRLLYFLPGDGAGNLGPVITVDTALDLSDIVLDDFDEDGIIDVIGIAGILGHFFFRGNGDFTFAAGAPIAGTEGRPLRGANKADFNNDGFVDIGSVDSSTKELLIYLGNGDGTLQAPTVAIVLVDALLVFPEPGDFNNDGLVDIAVVQNTFSDPTVVILISRGDGTFTPMPAVATGLRSALSLELADLDLDGTLDIVLAQTRGPFGVIALFGNGDGTLAQPPVVVSEQTQAMTVVADIDFDGHPDVLATESIVFNNGFRTLFSGIDIGMMSGRNAVRVSSSTALSGLFDANNDGRKDIVAFGASSSRDPYIRVFPATASGDFLSPITTTVGKILSSAVPGDFDNDGLMDMVLHTQPADGLTVLRGTGSGSFEVVATSALVDGELIAPPVDIDGDGNLDLIVETNGVDGRTLVLFGTGDGNFGNPVEIFPSDAGIAVSAQDWNGDGAIDIALWIPGSVMLIHQSSPRVFKQDSQIAVPGSAAVVQFVNFGDPSLPDLCILSGIGNNVLLIENTQGSFNAVANFFVSFPIKCLSGDLNGDGLGDVVVGGVGFDSTSTVLLARQGGGLDRQPPRTEPDGVSQRLDLADIDNDGFLDLLIVFGNLGNMAVLRGLGDGTFDETSYVRLGFSRVTGFDRNFALDDLDLDGDLDVVFRSTTEIVVIRNRTFKP